MNHIPASRIVSIAALAVLCCSFAPGLHAEDALFIGNSFTFGGPEKAVSDHGGVPKLVEAIAASKGKKLSSMMLAVSGKDFAYHVQQPVTDTDIKAKKWDFVILQGFSTEATHVDGPETFLKNGETLYKRIREESPQAKVVLYETWARPKGSDFYTGTSTAKTFVDPAQMDAEIQKNYTGLYQHLESLEAGDQLALAPVGLAFQRSLAKYPDINLSHADLHHANTNGDYLAALVIYATLFHDSPKGATREFLGTTLDAAVASKLQEIADEVAGPKAQSK